jgi:acylphosphatase
MLAKRIIIAGQVQGVGYRQWLVIEAKAAGLAGWVRNRVDGTVEALIAGEADAVEDLVRRCRRGPRMAVVVSIKEEFDDPPDNPAFHQRPTL